MSKAGIAIDRWKLPIFERHLSQAGYSFCHADLASCDAVLLTVETENLEALAAVVLAAQQEAAKERP